MFKHNNKFIEYFTFSNIDECNVTCSSTVEAVTSLLGVQSRFKSIKTLSLTTAAADTWHSLLSTTQADRQHRSYFIGLGLALATGYDPIAIWHHS